MKATTTAERFKPLTNKAPEDVLKYLASSSAGPPEAAIAVMQGVDAARAAHGRADEAFGHTFVTLTSTSEDDAVEAGQGELLTTLNNLQVGLPAMRIPSLIALPDNFLLCSQSGKIFGMKVFLSRS